MNMLFLYDTFKPYCERNGVHLLRDDLRYIATQLRVIPPDRHRYVMRDYYNIWMQGMADAKIKASAQNIGRNKANTWLREICCGV